LISFYLLNFTVLTFTLINWKSYIKSYLFSIIFHRLINLFSSFLGCDQVHLIFLLDFCLYSHPYQNFLNYSPIFSINKFHATLINWKSYIKNYLFSIISQNYLFSIISHCLVSLFSSFLGCDQVHLIFLLDFCLHSHPYQNFPNYSPTHKRYFPSTNFTRP